MLNMFEVPSWAPTQPQAGLLDCVEGQPRTTRDGLTRNLGPCEIKELGFALGLGACYQNLLKSRDKKCTTPARE